MLMQLSHTRRDNRALLTAIDALDALAEDAWSRRVSNYAVSAASDQALYEWLASIGKLPAVGKEVPSALLREWRALRRAQTTPSIPATRTQETH